MSAQKLLAEAEKALEKGKETEALEKFKRALAMEPMNQIAGTRLSAVYVQLGKVDLAGDVLKGLAGRLSEAGKAQIAIAIYKQAAELLPRDIALKLNLAQECESARKFNEALNYSQQALTFYLQRKKYFEAANVMPLLARLNEKDQNLKLMWFEVLKLSQAEQKVIHFLVNVFGPAGLSSTESNVGGDPKLLPIPQFQAFRSLVNYFPKDPKVPYALAWAHYKRELPKEAFLYLRECLRRDPDFTLAYILFARILADQKKVNEAYFVFKFGKERLAVDKSVDQLSLAKQMQQFEENNGWIKFMEGGLGEQPNLKSFLSGIRGAPVEDSEVMTTEELKNKEESPTNTANRRDMPPAEIELNFGGDGPTGTMEIEHTSGTRVETQEPVHKPAIPKEKSPPKPTFATEISPAIPPVAPIAKNQTSTQPEQDSGDLALQKSSSLPNDVSENLNKIKTKIVFVDDDNPTKVENSKMDFVLEVPVPKTAKLPDQNKKNPGLAPESNAEETTDSKLVNYNQTESTDLTGIIRSGTQSLTALADQGKLSSENLNSNATIVRPVEEENQKTIVEVIAEDLSAVSQVEFVTEEADGEAADAENQPTRSIIAEKSKKLMFSVSAEKREITRKIEPQASEDRTVLFSPMETIQAANVSRKPLFQAVQKIAQRPKEASIQTHLEELSNQGEKTQMLVRESLNQPEVKHTQTADPKKSLISEEPSEAQPIKIDEVNATANTQVQPEEPVGTQKAENLEGLNLKPAVGFQKIPELPTTIQGPEVEELPDLGEDLLEGATRILTIPKSIGHTEQLVREIAQNFQNQKEVKLEFSTINKNVDRLISKRKYYLARKVLRKFFGNPAIDQEAIKSKLRDIRSLEIPDSMYSAISNDTITKERSETIIETLEAEIFGDEIAKAKAADASMDESMYSEIYTSDPETQIDFGVGLLEMGLNLHAENIFQRIIEEYPAHAYNCFYLSALSKSARKDFAGSISILKMLSVDHSKNEVEKLPVYYALAESLERTKKFDDSQKYYKLVATVDANYRNTRERLKDTQ